MSSLAAETRTILRAHGLHPRKALGQNFLIDREALDSVVRAARLSPGDLVLEVGPGVGTLTAALAQHDVDVVAVELDEGLAVALRAQTAALPRVRVVAGNILRMDLNEIIPTIEPYKVVANIPYYITAPIVRHFLEGAHRPTVMVLMVQKEVAQRLTAGPGDLSLLGVSAQFYARVETVRVVPASSFLPPPQVDSAIVRLTPYTTPPLPVGDPARFFALVKAGFGEKRKQLHNALTHGLAHIPARDLDAALDAAGIDRTRRAETVSLDEWAALYGVLEPRLPRRKA